MPDLKVRHDGSRDARLKLFLHGFHLIHLELGLEQDSVCSSSNSFFDFCYSIEFLTRGVLDFHSFIEVFDEPVGRVRHDDLTSSCGFTFGVESVRQSWPNSEIL